MIIQETIIQNWLNFWVILANFRPSDRPKLAWNAGFRTMSSKFFDWFTSEHSGNQSSELIRFFGHSGHFLLAENCRNAGFFHFRRPLFRCDLGPKDMSCFLILEKSKKIYIFADLYLVEFDSLLAVPNESHLSPHILICHSTCVSASGQLKWRLPIQSL